MLAFDVPNGIAESGEGASVFSSDDGGPVGVFPLGPGPSTDAPLFAFFFPFHFSKFVPPVCCTVGEEDMK